MSVTSWVRDRPLAGDAGLAVLVALPLGASSLSLLTDAGVATVVRTIALLVVAHASLAWRRSAPAGAFAVVAAVELALLVSPALTIDTADGPARYTPVLLPSSLVFALALYAAAAYGSDLLVRVSLAVALAGAVATSVRSATGTDVVDGAVAVVLVTAGLLAAVTAAWTLGVFRRAQFRQADAERERRAAEAVRAERERVARELHDVIAHSLAVVVRQADAGRFVAASDPAAAVGIFETVAETGRAALTDMRGLLGVLRTGPSTAPAPTLADLDDLVGRVRAGGQSVHVNRSGAPVPLTPAANLAAFRFVQEGLTNVVKHAGEDARAEVALTWCADGLQLRVADDGGGAPRDAVGPGGHGGHGLAGLRERILLAGGTLDSGPEGAGFALTAWLPGATP